MEIIMTSEKLVITRIISKTKAKFFEDLRVDDIIEFSVPLKAAGSNRGTYATSIKAYCYRTKACVYRTFNQMDRILGNFDFEELTEDEFNYIINQKERS